MKELSRESRALLAEARRIEHLSTAEKSRIHSKLAQRIGAGLAVGSAVTATATAAEAAHTGAWASVLAWLPAATKVVGVVVVTGSVSVGVLKATRVSPPAANARPGAVVTAAINRTPVASGALAPAVRAPAAVNSGQVDAPEPVPAAQPVRVKRAPVDVAPAPEQPAVVEDNRAQVPQPGVDRLSRQVAAIRAARVAIRNGDAHAALAALDRDLPEGQGGALAPEADLARVAAYCRLGDVVSARRIASRFVAQYPKSPLVARMRESCAGVPSEQAVTNF